MVAKLSFALLAAFALVCAGPSAQAVDPFGFQFGYTMGYQNSFRNRLPTPPYFSIYPPVYYGKRYERPYGDSPYASFPQLRSAPDYHPVPKEVPFRTRSIVNPHVEQNGVHGHHIHSEPIAVAAPRIGRTIEIVNPYAQDVMVTQSN